MGHFSGGVSRACKRGRSGLECNMIYVHSPDKKSHFEWKVQITTKSSTAVAINYAADFKH